MAKHNNTAKQDISRAAHALFLSEGYAKTGYQLIADRLGMDRGLVQYHFPRKEILAVDLLRRVIDLSEDHIRDNRLADRVPLAYRMVLAQLTYAFLGDARVRAFTIDVLSSRPITHEVLVMDAAWNAEFLGDDDGGDAFDNAILAVGGAYELLYHQLVTDPAAIDPRRLARHTLLSSGTDPTPRTLDRIRAHELDDRALAVACDHLTAALGAEG